MIRSQIIGANNLIEKLGRPIIISTQYTLATAASIGNRTLNLIETTGIKVDHVFTLGSEQITVTSVSDQSITINNPLTGNHLAGDFISSLVTTKAVPAVNSRTITRDNLEYIRRVRISQDIQVNCGSTAEYGGKDFFVTGFDIGDISLYLKLTESNGYMTLQRMQEGEYNGFSYDMIPVDIARNIPAYFEHISSETRVTPIGKTPSTYQMATISKIHKARLNDIVVRDNLVYRVSGMDEYRMRNFDTLFLDYDHTIQPAQS